MWLNDSAQTAETTSLSPWNMEQNRWTTGGMQYNGLTTCDERLRAIVPPAFRNGNAKVVWQDPKSLEANVNEALGITNCYGAPTSQYAEQNGLNVSIQSSYAGGANPWNQSEAVRPNLWEYNAASSTPLPNGFSASVLSGNGMSSKGWCAPEEQWDNIPKRNVSFAYGPPPSFNSPANAWQQNGFRNFPPPSARFTPSIPYEGSGINGSAMQSSGMPSPVGAPLQRSRLQSLWNAGPPANNLIAGMCVPPPTRDYSMVNSSGPFMPPNGVNPIGYGIPKTQYGPPFTNSVSSQLIGSVNSAVANNSFMGEDSVWQDPNQELRKWQRDTGTAIWGDPEKQTREIRRWLPPIEDEDGQNCESDPKRKKIIPMGWGDLPVSFNSSKSPVSTSSGVSSIGQPAGWVRKSSQPVAPTSNGLFDSSLLNKTLSSQTLNKINSVLGQDELASLVAAFQINSLWNGDGLPTNNVSVSNGFGGISDLLKGDIRDGYTSMKINVPDTRSKNRDATVGNGLAALSEAATATMPRFGDSLLDVTTGLDQPKSLFSF